MGDLDMNLPGMSTTSVKVKLPVCKSIFKEEYHIHITGTVGCIQIESVISLLLQESVLLSQTLPDSLIHKLIK